MKLKYICKWCHKSCLKPTGHAHCFMANSRQYEVVKYNCIKCGKEFQDQKHLKNTPLNPTPLCHKCANGYYHCSECGIEVEANNANQCFHKKGLCKDCYNKKFHTVKCLCCGKSFIQKGREKICSKECKNKWTSILMRKKADSDKDLWTKAAYTLSSNCQKTISNRLSYCKCRQISKTVFICDKCNTAWIEPTGSGGFVSNRIKAGIDICPHCGPRKMTPHDKGVQWALNTATGGRVSNQEKIIQQFLTDNNIEFVIGNRTILNGKELDIFIPSKNLAIEVNGVYYHSDKFKDKYYHQNKTEICESKGIHLIHLYDMEIELKKDIVFDKLKSYLGLNEKLFARKCKLETIKFPKEFYQNNHIQGAGPSCSINYCLRYNDELVAAMSFRKRNGKMELMRYASKLGLNVVGGMSKLLARAKQDICEPIYSFADRRFTYSKCNGYSLCGFELIEKQVPGYCYWDDKHNCFLNREKCQKHKLMKLLGYTDPNVCSEKSMADELGLKKLYDCGQLLFKTN